jgi:hypothetical protein
MEKKTIPKSSDELYGEGPARWMFLPYYLAIEYKEELAESILSNELDKHYMKQDQAIVTEEYKAKNFNASLRYEMDVAISAQNIDDVEGLLNELKECYEKIYNKYKKVNK